MPDKIELLAPAGTWDVLEKVAEAGADAVYIGGKRFNMRLLKGNYNFTDDEIQNGVKLLHHQNKKLYITINNLYIENEINEIKDYLFFLENIGVDGLIVQDLSIVNIHKELNLTIPLHASVQMGIGNAHAVKFLEKHGLARVILSKNLSLDEIKEISQTTTMGIEFFAHGDLCISHTGQCHMSSFVAGASANRGKCIKPCRWQYSLKEGTKAYYLAHNDLSLYPYIKDLIKAGVTSLKIEGRMRSADYLSTIVNTYRLAIDKILEDEVNYKLDVQELERLENVKVRNYTAAGLWGKLEADVVDISGEREPFFPTKARELKKLTEDDFNENIINNILKCNELAVKVGNIESYKAVKDYCDTIIIGLEKFENQNSGFSLEEIKELLINDNPKVQIKIETPRIVTQSNWSKIEGLTELKNYNNLTGFIVNDLGSLKYLTQQGFKTWGGPGLNITNSKAADLLINENLLGLCLSPELRMPNLKILDTNSKNFEIIVHGPLDGIITDYPIIKHIKSLDIKENKYNLFDEYAQGYPMRIDEEGRTHIYFPHDLSLYNYLSTLLEMDISRMRIDGQFYDTETLLQLVTIYRQKLDALEKNIDIKTNSFANMLQLFNNGLTDLSFTRPNV